MKPNGYTQLNLSKNKLTAIIVSAVLVIVSITVYLWTVLPQPVLVFSVPIRLAAFFIAVLAYFNWKDWRVLPLALMFFLMAFRQTLTLHVRAGVIDRTPLTASLAEVPGFIVTLLALISIIYIWHLFSYKKLIRRAEKDLAESEEKFRTIADCSYDWDAWHGPDGKCIYISPSCERITGYSVDDFFNDPDLLLSIVHPDDREKMQTHRQQHFDGSFEKSEINFRIITKTGELRWIWHQCHAAISSKGEWLGRRTTNRDVTLLKDAEEKLKRREKQLKDAQQIAHLGHWELDVESNTLYWSDEIYRIFCFDPQEFTASYEAFLDTVHPEDRDYVKRAYTESVENKTKYDIEHRILLKNGNEKWVREIGVTEYDANDRVTRSMGIIHDITEIKALRGILPICSKCHKIRDDEGYWQKVDHYITEHTEAVFSHGMCKQCSDELYGGQDWYEKAKKEGKISDA